MRNSKPFKGDLTDERPVRSNAIISIILNILKRELHLRSLLNDDMNSNPLILWPLELEAG